MLVFTGRSLHRQSWGSSRALFVQLSMNSIDANGHPETGPTTEHSAQLAMFSQVPHVLLLDNYVVRWRLPLAAETEIEPLATFVAIMTSESAIMRTATRSSARGDAKS